MKCVFKKCFAVFGDAVVIDSLGNAIGQPVKH